MKQLILLLAISLPLFAFSQSSLQAEEETTTEEVRLKVMVIPFHPIRYYFSDCDRKLSKKSKVNEWDVRNSFRAGMDYAAENNISKNHDVFNLLQMKDSVSKEMLLDFYQNVSYSYEAPTRGLSKKSKNIFKRMKEKISEATGKKEKVETDEECYTTIDGEDAQYMKCSFNNPEFLESLNEVYEPDYFVTINQMEIKTDYEKCIDRELGKYRRRIKVHYNVFTKAGQLVYGDVITAKYESTSNDVNRIIQDNFGLLAEFITQSLP